MKTTKSRLLDNNNNKSTQVERIRKENEQKNSPLFPSPPLTLLAFAYCASSMPLPVKLIGKNHFSLLSRMTVSSIVTTTIYVFNESKPYTVSFTMNWISLLQEDREEKNIYSSDLTHANHPNNTRRNAYFHWITLKKRELLIRSLLDFSFQCL